MKVRVFGFIDWLRGRVGGQMLDSIIHRARNTFTYYRRSRCGKVATLRPSSDCILLRKDKRILSFLRRCQGSSRWPCTTFDHAR
jgi:hypothetical protein